VRAWGKRCGASLGGGLDGRQISCSVGAQGVDRMITKKSIEERVKTERFHGYVKKITREERLQKHIRAGKGRQFLGE